LGGATTSEATGATVGGATKGMLGMTMLSEGIKGYMAAKAAESAAEEGRPKAVWGRNVEGDGLSPEQMAFAPSSVAPGAGAWSRPRMMGVA